MGWPTQRDPFAQYLITNATNSMRTFSAASQCPLRCAAPHLCRAAWLLSGGRVHIQRLSVCVTHDETVRRHFGRPRRRQAATCRHALIAVSIWSIDFPEPESLQESFIERSFPVQNLIEIGTRNAMPPRKCALISLSLNRGS